MNVKLFTALSASALLASAAHAETFVDFTQTSGQTARVHSSQSHELRIDFAIDPDGGITSSAFTTDEGLENSIVGNGENTNTNKEIVEGFGFGTTSGSVTQGFFDAEFSLNFTARGGNANIFVSNESNWMGLGIHGGNSFRIDWNGEEPKEIMDLTFDLTDAVFDGFKLVVTSVLIGGGSQPDVQITDFDSTISTYGEGVDGIITLSGSGFELIGGSSGVLELTQGLSDGSRRGYQLRGLSFDVVPLSEPGLSFEDWLDIQFPDEEGRTNPELIRRSATPAGDGMSNLLKYAFGFEPLTPVAGADLPQPTVEEGTLTLTYRERVGATEITYLPEKSFNLTDWDSEGIQRISPAERDGEFDWVTIQLELNEEARAFLRIQVIDLSFDESFLDRGPVAETWREAFERLGPIGGAPPPENRPELEGKVVTGYQGWFGAEGDGSGMGWRHYGGGSQLYPGRVTIDLWPDMSELDEDEKYPTLFTHEDGSTATLFSSYNAKTVDRHFRWMKEYGIDSAMLQRFGASLRNPRLYDFRTGVLENSRRAAERHDRSWAIMYDLSGLRAEEVVPIITEDWKWLVNRGEILKDRGYLHHQEQPLVAIWGVGFSDGRDYGLEEAAALIDFFKNDPVFGGNAVMLGIPYYWRTQDRDAVSDPELHDLLKTVDILSPWAVGRYKMQDGKTRVPDRVAGDIAWTQEHGVAYLPVIFPGFSWQNLKRWRGEDAELNAFPREQGRFLWMQALEAIRAGSTAIYVAMFDEVDEATAIFKGSNNPPVGESNFITYEGLQPDHYLWLTGQIRKLLRGEIPKTEDPPHR